MVWLVGCGGAVPETTHEETASSEARAEAAVTTTGAEVPAAPRVYEGVAGGPDPAAGTLEPWCPGWIPTAPQVEIDLTVSTSLAFRVRSEVDTTLAVVFPDGSVACDDDSIGYDPRVTSELTPGHYRVFVGTYDTGVSASFRLEVGPPPNERTRPSAPVTPIAGVPLECGMTTPDVGSIRVGMPVVLGAHSPWTGPDGHGGEVAADTWWSDDMWQFVGEEAIVGADVGLDPVGCPYVRVDVDGGGWGWRIRDLSPSPRTAAWRSSSGLTAPAPSPIPTFTGVGIPNVPADCGQTAEDLDFGPIHVGSVVVLGEHTGWTGPDGQGGEVRDDTWWNEQMATWVGRTATVTELHLDPVGCSYVRVDVDGGTWGWRIRDLSQP